jgi:hypothetical protein
MLFKACSLPLPEDTGSGFCNENVIGSTLTCLGFQYDIIIVGYYLRKILNAETQGVLEK